MRCCIVEYKRSRGWLCQIDFRGRKYPKWGRVVTPGYLINYLIKYFGVFSELIVEGVKVGI